MEFGILGAVRVVMDGRPLHLPRGKRATLLVALLLRRNQVVPAQRLTEWLWDDPPEGAAAALQSHVSRLRADLSAPQGEPLLVTRNAGYELRVPDDAVDAARFERVIAAGRALLVSDPGSATSILRQGLSLWRGHALEGFSDLALAHAESSRLEELRLTVVEDLIEAELTLGRHAGVIGELQPWVADHPTRERLTAQLMRALYHAGRQAEALEAYDRLRQRLTDELGIEPTVELRRLERAVLRQEVAGGAGSTSGAPPLGSGVVTVSATPRDRHLPERTPFVGREVERADVRTLMERALAGKGCLAMIGGEPGVGKTRLCEEVAADGGRLGMRVLTGHCYQRAGDLPYMPWAELMEGAMADTAPAALFEALGDAAPEMARIAPKLRRLIPEIPPPLDLPPDQQRRFTFTSLADYIERVAGVQPRLYILEDLHWADESTLLFLAYLAERLARIPVLVLATYRDLPVEMSPVLRDTLAELVRTRHARRLSLHRHPRAEVEALLHGLSGQSPPATVVTAIHDETEGNAFFVEEVYHHLVETGQLIDEGGRFRPDVRIDELDVPENVRLVIGQRLDRLTDVTRGLLTVAAIIGYRFDLQLLQEASRLDEETLLASLDDAERAHLAVADGVSARRYRFGHELVRQTLLARLSPPRRQRHHLEVADSMERVHVDDPKAVAGSIAHHLVEAGPIAEATRTATYLIAAGDRAIEATAFEEAVRHYQFALSMVAADDSWRRGDLLARLGGAHRCLGSWADAEASWMEALALLEGVGEPEAAAAVCYELSRHYAWTLRTELMGMAQRGLAIVGDAAAPERVRFLSLGGFALGAAGRYEDATAQLDEARSLADRLGDARLTGIVESHYTVTELVYLRDCTECGRRAAATLRSAGDLWTVADVLAHLTSGLIFRGRIREAREVEDELEPLAQRLGHTHATAVLRRSRFPRVAAEDADLGELDVLAASLSTMAERTGSAGWVSLSATLRGIVQYWRGHWTQALESMSEAARVAPPNQWFGLHHGYLSVLLAARGDRRDALAVLDSVSDHLPVRGRPNVLGRWLLAILAAEAVGMLDEPERSLALYPLVDEALAGGTVMRQGDGGLLHRSAGMAAAAAGLYDDAEAHFELALRQAQDLPHLIERPCVRHGYARFLTIRNGAGDLERAGSLLEEALAGYRAIGMPGHTAAVEQLLRDR